MVQGGAVREVGPPKVAGPLEREEGALRPEQGSPFPVRPELRGCVFAVPDGLLPLAKSGGSHRYAAKHHGTSIAQVLGWAAKGAGFLVKLGQIPVMLIATVCQALDKI